MKKYQVKKYPDIGYIVFSISASNPTDYMLKIEQELLKKRYLGNVFFDLLLANGNNFNRYLKAYFNGNKFQKNSILDPIIVLE